MSDELNGPYANLVKSLGFSDPTCIYPTGLGWHTPARSIIYAATDSDGQDVTIKLEPPAWLIPSDGELDGLTPADMLRNEFMMLQRAKHVPVVPRARRLYASLSEHPEDLRAYGRNPRNQAAPITALAKTYMSGTHPPSFGDCLDELTQAVTMLHDNGIANLDLNPRNVLVDSGRVVVLDLGIAQSFEDWGAAFQEFIDHDNYKIHQFSSMDE
ncbi:MAG: hypothetical protein ABIA93_00455 [Candidatus Woesearchaeota archaeon]